MYVNTLEEAKEKIASFKEFENEAKKYSFARIADSGMASILYHLEDFISVGMKFDFHQLIKEEKEYGQIGAIITNLEKLSKFSGISAVEIIDYLISICDRKESAFGDLFNAAYLCREYKKPFPANLDPELILEKIQKVDPTLRY